MMSSTPANTARRGFTLLEVMVSVALLIVVMAAISRVFTISSDATARTTANTRVTAANAAVRQALTDQVAKMVSRGILIIDCPKPTHSRCEIKKGERQFRLQHGSMVFLAAGDVGEYQSFTDPTRGRPDNPTLKTAESSEAIVYFGPGTPLTRLEVPPLPQYVDGVNHLSQALPAADWIFQQRTILLLLEKSLAADPLFNPPRLDDLTTGAGMLNGGPLLPEFRDGSMDAIVSGPDMQANARTIADYVLGLPLDGTDLLSAHPSIEALWKPSFAPSTATMNNTNNRDYYTRSGFNFVPHLADFRIEWTDGRQIDALGPDGLPGTGDEAPETRWFGLRPDPNFVVTKTVLDELATTDIPYIARRRIDVVNDTTQEELDAYARVEWASARNVPDPNAAYRAIWRADTWDSRPKALRFTYRIYDAGNRMAQDTTVDLDEDGIYDPDDSEFRRTMRRYGRRFSIVVPVP